MRIVQPCLLAAFALASVLPALAAGAAGSGPVVIPRSEQFTLRSREGSREYRIFLARPAAMPPPAGYPVVYVLDGNAFFGTMTGLPGMRLPMCLASSRPWTS